jgi:hypothetical protein
MQIDLASHIEKLIFLHDTVVVPNLGAFVASRIPSTTDDSGANNVINPPARALAFNETLVYDDGLLTGDIAQSLGISSDEARNLVQTEVEGLQHRLNQREIVSLNGIGRLYKNYVQKIQFLPDSANFSTESYGLPPLQFSSITHSREVSEPQTPLPAENHYTPPPAAPTTADTAQPETPANRARWVTPLLVSLLLVLIAAVVVWQWKSAKNGTSILDRLRGAETTTVDSTEQAATTPETSATSEKTADTPVSAPETTENTDDGGVEIEMITPPEPEPEEATLVLTPESQEAVLDNPKKSTSAGKECILIVATLSDPANVQKLKTKLTENNFTVYDAPKGKGRQIGVRFNYTDVVEIQQNIVALQQLTGTTEIWIKKK